MGIKYPTSLAVLKDSATAIIQNSMFKPSQQKDPVPRRYAFSLKPFLLWNQMLSIHNSVFITEQSHMYLFQVRMAVFFLIILLQALSYQCSLKTTVHVTKNIKKFHQPKILKATKTKLRCNK